MRTGSSVHAYKNIAWLDLLGHPGTLAVTIIVMDHHGYNYHHGDDSFMVMTAYLQL